MSRNLREIFEIINYFFIYSSIVFYTCHCRGAEERDRSAEGALGRRSHAANATAVAGCSSDHIVFVL
jgi:hypothetical protein